MNDYNYSIECINIKLPSTHFSAANIGSSDWVEITFFTTPLYLCLSSRSSCIIFNSSLNNSRLLFFFSPSFFFFPNLSNFLSFDPNNLAYSCACSADDLLSTSSDIFDCGL